MAEGLFRQYLRDSHNPLILLQVDRLAPQTMTFRVVIDHSTSVNRSGRIEYSTQLVMLQHLTAVELTIPHQVVVTPNEIRGADLENGKRGLALVAGIVPAQTSFGETDLAVSHHSE